MMDHLFNSIYGSMLRLYPRNFREEFNDEMQEIFSLSIDAATRRGALAAAGLLLKELGALPGAVLLAHLREKQGKIDGIETSGDVRGIHLSGKELLIALAVFLLPALLILMNATPGASLSTVYPAALVFLVAMILLGILGGFSRWSLPYLGFALSLFGYLFVFRWVADLISPALMVRVSPGPWDDSTRLLLKAVSVGWLWFTLFSYTLLLVAVLGIFRRFRRLLSCIRRDWTLLSYILYGEILFALILLFDDYRFTEPYAIASLLCLVAGGWLYLRSPHPWRRVLALGCGLTLAMGIAVLDRWLVGPGTKGTTWVYELSGGGGRWPESVLILSEWVLMLVVLLLPGFLYRLTRRGGLASE